MSFFSPLASAVSSFVSTSPLATLQENREAQIESVNKVLSLLVDLINNGSGFHNLMDQLNLLQRDESSQEIKGNLGELREQLRQILLNNYGENKKYCENVFYVEMYYKIQGLFKNELTPQTDKLTLETFFLLQKAVQKDQLDQLKLLLKESQNCEHINADIPGENFLFEDVCLSTLSFTNLNKNELKGLVQAKKEILTLLLENGANPSLYKDNFNRGDKKATPPFIYLLQTDFFSDEDKTFLLEKMAESELDLNWVNGSWRNPIYNLIKENKIRPRVLIALLKLGLEKESLLDWVAQWQIVSQETIHFVRSLSYLGETQSEEIEKILLDSFVILKPQLETLQKIYAASVAQTARECSDRNLYDRKMIIYNGCRKIEESQKTIIKNWIYHGQEDSQEISKLAKDAIFCGFVFSPDLKKFHAIFLLAQEQFSGTTSTAYQNMSHISALLSSVLQEQQKNKCEDLQGRIIKPIEAYLGDMDALIYEKCKEIECDPFMRDAIKNKDNQLMIWSISSSLTKKQRLA